MTTLTTDLDRLQQYAENAGSKVYTRQADLDPKDKPMLEMHAWSLKQGDIVVMTSGLILTSNPVSRSVHNCKIVMLNKGLKSGKVIPATPELVSMLLTQQDGISDHSNIESVSDQQQRLRLLVHEALQAQASDIHIEVRTDVARLRFRKHGELYLHAEWLPQLGREIASVAFNKETDNAVSHFNPMVPQSASMSLRIDSQDIRLRLASMPAHGGFDVVMRVLTGGDEAIQTLEALGYQPQQITLITKALRTPHGAVLIAGPTGSGKTTTVASCVNMIRAHRKVYTIEEPVEKVVNTVTQVPVNTEHDDRSFASMGRAALRMDPDVIVLGEMRDEETAHVMVRAAITGHLVFSTLHTNSAPAIVTRLVDMGISPVMLGDSNLLVCLICQRLVPTLCPACAMPISQSDLHRNSFDRWQAVFADVMDSIKVRGYDCDACNGTGLGGRTVIAEVIWVDDIGREYIQQADTLGWEKHLRQHGWIDHATQALDLVRKGYCDPLDMERIVGEIHPFDQQQAFKYNDRFQG